MSEVVDEPRLVALLVCDAIEVERDGHKTASHMMSRLMLERVPAVRSLTIFARYVMPPGMHRVDVHFVDQHENQLWTPDPFESMVNPGGTSREHIRRQDVTFRDFGTYEARLIVNGEVIGRAPLSAWKAPPFAHLARSPEDCGQDSRDYG